MNSLQSAGEGSVDLSKGPSLRGDPPGVRLGLDDGVRGSLYRDLRKEEHRNIQTFFYKFCKNVASLAFGLSCIMTHLQHVSEINCKVGLLTVGV